MTIPKAIIEKAIEGGYFFPAGTTSYQIALDPSFWQSLGKALGYDDDKARGSVKIYEGTWSRTQMRQPKIMLLDDWQNMALDFYDLILTGGDTEKFWTDLLSKERENV